jgi:predicted dinucleotide-binding enzyme
MTSRFDGSVGTVRIGIIGAGHIGGTAAKLFSRAGHEVALSNSRGPASLDSLVSTLGPNVRAVSAADAVKFGDVVLLALPYRNKQELPPGHLFDGKIVIDAMNAYSATGEVMDLGERTSSEEVAKLTPGARLVKAFNTIYWRNLEAGGRPSPKDRLAIFVAGDDRGAKEVVTKLIDEIGFAPIDTGSLRDGGRRQQPGSPVYGRPLTATEARKILDKR